MEEKCLTIMDPALWGTSRDDLRDALNQIGMVPCIIAVGWGRFRKMQCNFNDRPLLQNNMQLYITSDLASPGSVFGPRGANYKLCRVATGPRFGMTCAAIYALSRFDKALPPGYSACHSIILIT